MHLRKRQVGATPVVAFFLNRHFWCQKHRFKPKYRDYFWHLSLITKRSPWSDPQFPLRLLRVATDAGGIEKEIGSSPGHPVDRQDHASTDFRSNIWKKADRYY